jgi:hypothetical protein
MVQFIDAAVIFVIALVISAIIIFVITKIFGEKEGIGTAFLAALIGTIIYTIAYYLLGTGLLAAVIGGIVWLLALKGLYDIGWLKALIIAIVIWVAAAIVGIFVPTLIGPL